MTDYDRVCLANFKHNKARLEAAIEGKNPTDLVRPLIGDAPTKPVTYWLKELGDLNRWIAEIEEAV
jgi:hypothetical protein